VARRQRVIDHVGRLLSPLLGTLDRVAWVQRHLYPPVAGQLANELAPCTDTFAGPLDELLAARWPDELHGVRDRLVDAVQQTRDLVGAFVDAARTPGNPIGLFRALRRFAHVQETLFPLAPALDPVSRWFIEPARRDDDDLVARLRAGALRDDGTLGVRHADNERGARGGFSVYVPESWDGATPLPLVMALHGGTGHGRDFLWTWLSEARSRGVLLVAPTSRGRTWSIMGGEDVDAAMLREAVASLAARHPIDRSRVLLTGMSDGATYALLCGLRDGMPFTHLAPACGVLHPSLLTGGGLARARGRPIYLVHGTHDWMFPVATARRAREALEHVGARLVYREIDDLSHTYPREENARILDWLADPGTQRAAAAGPIPSAPVGA
jgi:phospholipase/carboxylesterase